MSLLSGAVHDWAFALEQRNSVHSLFLDLAKAFDSVPHYRLLLRLDLLQLPKLGGNFWTVVSSFSNLS